MTKYSMLLLFSFVAACSAPESTQGTLDTREPVAIRYVKVPEIRVHAQPVENAPVTASYLNGETLSVFGQQGEWSEVRVGAGAGWVRTAELGSADDVQQQRDNPVPSFRVAPSPVTQLTARGDIHLEATVNTDGDVVDVRTLYNDTGSEALVAQNTAALRKAKFHPMVRDGKKIPFKYDHRVSY